MLFLKGIDKMLKFIFYILMFWMDNLYNFNILLKYEGGKVIDKFIEFGNFNFVNKVWFLFLFMLK